MATSGSFNTSGYVNEGWPDYARFEWTLTSQSATSNTSTISWKVTTQGGDKSARYTYSKSKYVKVDGEVHTNEENYKVYNNTVIFEGTKTIAHAAGGSGSFEAVCKMDFYNHTGYNSTGSSSWSLPQIDRNAPTLSATIASVTHNSMRVKCTANTTCKDAYYAVDNGAWKSCSLDSYFNVTGLSAKTEHSIEFRATRTHNNVIGYSGKKYATTYPTPVYIDYIYVTATSPTEITVTVSASSADVDYIKVRCSDGQTRTIRAQDSTFTFTVAPETFYRVWASAVTKTSGVVSSEATDYTTTPADSFCYVIEPNGSVSSKKKMFLIDTNGIVTEVKKGNVSVL